MKLDNRLWILVTAILVVGVFAGAWFLGAAPFVQSATGSISQVASVATQNAATEAQIASLKQTKAKLPELSSELAELRRAVPDSIDGSAFIAEVNGIAARTGVSVSSITLGPPTAYEAPVTPDSTAPAATSGAAATPAPTPSATASAAPVATAPVDPAAPAITVDPAITAANFVLIETAISVSGSHDAVNAFLTGLQHGGRLFLVTKINSTAEEGGNVQLSTTGNIYVVKKASTTTTTGAASNG